MYSGIEATKFSFVKLEEFFSDVKETAFNWHDDNTLGFILKGCKIGNYQNYTAWLLDIKYRINKLT